MRSEGQQDQTSLKASGAGREVVQVGWERVQERMLINLRFI